MSKKMNRLFLLIIIGIFSVSTIFAAVKSDDNVWQKVDESKLKNRPTQNFVNDDSFTAFRLNRIALQTILTSAPLEFMTIGEKSKVILTLPMPDGTFEKFAIKESPIMEAELAAKFPEIKTYLGQGIDNPTATTRFDLTPQGFHAMILSDKGTIIIDPYSKSDTENYISFNKANAVKSGDPFVCLVGGTANTFAQKDLNYKTYNDTPNVVTNAGTFRQYRLALAATGEYTAVFGGTVAFAMAAMTTSMNRVNGIYERELSMRMNMIANNNLIVYTNGATDPYTNDDGFAMLAENQSNLNAVIGTANYDIGHVFSTGGGGVASLNSPCGTSKARGVTGLPSPIGDVFDVDYVAHEMGHQWGGSHTFNGSVSNCSGGNRSAANAYEPGSGTTIQAYAGICSPQNTQSNSNDYFHVRSLEQMVTFMNGSGNCSANTANGNNAPAVSIVGGTTFNIPRNTPFMLTASGSDANGDTLTYNWEEYSLGAAGAPSSTANAPMMRSYLATTSPTRIFPSLTYILNNDNVPPTTYTGTSASGAVCGGTCLTAEFLSSITRTMPFQVTARDNRAGGGGITSTQGSVVVDVNSGPFKVTAQDSILAPNWQVGTTQTITWNVANTTAAPVSAANVDIHLSTDGGQTFPFTLATGTPNDGTQDIVVPVGTATSQARIRVMGSGNIFFDISNVNFTITAPTAALANVSGKVVTAKGIGISRTNVRLLKTSTGEVSYATTNMFGRFKFADVAVGETYSISVIHRKYNFPNDTQVFDLSENIDDLTFIGFDR